MAHNDKNGFTLAEVAVTAFIAVLIFLAAWSFYIIGSTWWYEVSPRIEAQRAARLALQFIIEGRPDSTAGFDVIASLGRINRSNGIGYAVFEPDIPSLGRINFGLYQDRNPAAPNAVNNVRSFYLARDDETTLMALYYSDSTGSSHLLKGTLGLTALTFAKEIDPVTGRILITVTTVSDRPVAAVGHEPYHAIATYTEKVYLKNV